MKDHQAGPEGYLNSYSFIHEDMDHLPLTDR